ncbi:MAG TPA: PD-(D/E)XK nuclease family protein [Mesotoga sp.]|nr:PD-(D/E)XK nuclease family protein [Mesotoga sp.]
MQELLKKALPLSYSRINTFLKCPRKFYLRYIEGLEEPPTPAMQIGKSVHEALDTLIKNRGDMLKALEKLDTLPKQDYTIARKRFKTGVKMLQGLPVAASELKFGFDNKFNKVDFDSPNCFFRGVIDLVIRNGDGSYSVRDWKTGWSEPDPRQVFIYSLPLIRAGLNVNDAGFFLLATGGVYPYAITDIEVDSAFNFITRKWQLIKERLEEAEYESVDPIEKFQPDVSGGCSYCSFHERCKLPSVQGIEDEIRNAAIEKEKAKEVFDRARDIVKETGQPLFVTDESVMALTEELKLKIAGRGEEARNGNKAIVAQWLIENNGAEFINISPSMPPEIARMMPPEVGELCQYKASPSVKVISAREYIKQEV